MPAMASITVKAADAVTDVVYNALTPSSGDTVDALWRVEAAHATPVFRPTFRASARYNGTRDSRRVTVEMSFPLVGTVAGDPALVGVSKWTVNGVIPLKASSTLTDEAAAQLANLLKSALMQEVMKAGFAPT